MEHIEADAELAQRALRGAAGERVKALGRLHAALREAARAAQALRELVADSAIDCADHRHLRVDRDLEQAVYVATLPDATLPPKQDLGGSRWGK